MINIESVTQATEQTKKNRRPISIEQYLLAHSKAINLIRSNNINFEKARSEGYKYIVFSYNPTFDPKRSYELAFNLDSLSFYSKVPGAILSSFIESNITNISLRTKEELKRG